MLKSWLQGGDPVDQPLIVALILNVALILFGWRRHDALAREVGERTAAEVMTPAPRTIAPQALARSALAEMQDRKITCLFVVDPEGRPAGLIHVHDFLRSGMV